jgi:hypothetical protein
MRPPSFETLDNISTGILIIVVLIAAVYIYRSFRRSAYIEVIESHPEGGEPYRQRWQYAMVDPRHDASPDDLRALGQELQLWLEAKDWVDSIYGLDNLLDGKHPLRDGPILLPADVALDIFNTEDLVQFEEAQGPAIIYSYRELSGAEVIESLKAALSPELVGNIREPSAGDW